MRRIELGPLEPGLYESPKRAAFWNGRNDLGEPVAGGVYVVELIAGKARSQRRIVLAK
ncbi:MAG: hypothetical protein KatS3mg115_2395 [Candidatus Poribacteria bacterium]|nr:MAG: hypothetical protein KatS3mg115_2395 [Candidatus Poribacteria bacterium]